jgi:hypothetical protein
MKTCDECDALRSELRAAVDALRVEKLRREGRPNPWGHDCRWCADCIERSLRMQAEAISAYDAAHTEAK